MTLAEQFPDVSMLIREKRKSDSMYRSALRFRNIHYSPISPDQKFYDAEFRIFHYKLLAFIVFLMATLFLLILNGRGFWKWIIS